MNDHQKFERLTITLPPELLAWVKSQKKELETADRRVTTSISAIIADAVQSMRDNEEQGKAQPPDNATNVDTTIVKPYKRSAGGSSTRETSCYRKGG